MNHFNVLKMPLSLNNFGQQRRVLHSNTFLLHCLGCWRFLITSTCPVISSETVDLSGVLFNDIHFIDLFLHCLYVGVYLSCDIQWDSRSSRFSFKAHSTHSVDSSPAGLHPMAPTEAMMASQNAKRGDRWLSLTFTSTNTQPQSTYLKGTPHFMKLNQHTILFLLVTNRFIYLLQFLNQWLYE